MATDTDTLPWEYHPPFRCLLRAGRAEVKMPCLLEEFFSIDYYRT
jgi:hypothetical protein